MDLLEWKRGCAPGLPRQSGGKTACFSSRELAPPRQLSTLQIRALRFDRSPGGGPIAIEGTNLQIDGREAVQSLGLVFVACALSSTTAASRINLTAAGSELSEIVIWPAKKSYLAGQLTMQEEIVGFRFRPRLPEQNPNYLTFEDLKPEIPREHLPCIRLGHPDVEKGGMIRKDEPVACHFSGTPASMIWMGRLLLNLGLEDSRAQMAHLYNFPPEENLAVDSGEIRFVIQTDGESNPWCLRLED